MLQRALQYITLVLIAGILLIPPFFGGGLTGSTPYAIVGVSGVTLILLVSIIGKKEIESLLYNKKRLTSVVLALAFLIGMLASTLFSSAFHNSVDAYLQWLAYLSLFFVAVVYPWSKRSIQWIILGLISVGVILSLIGAEMYVSGQYSRMISRFFWPNAFAGYLLMTLPLVLALFFREKKSSRVLVYGVAASVMGGTFLLTESRGAFISIIIPILFLVWVFRSYPKKELASKIAAIFVGIALVASALSSADTGSVRSFSVSRPPLDNSAEQTSVPLRLQFWKNSLEIWVDNPVFGTGLGTFGNVYPQYQDDAVSFAERPHNQYLKTLSETGIMGAVPLYALLVYIFITGASRIWREKDNILNKPELFYASFLFAGIFGAMMHIGVDFDWMFPANAITFWIIAGIVIRYMTEKQYETVNN